MSTMPKRNDWFMNYQSIGSISGQRDLSRRQFFFVKDDFTNKSVLDIGCNIGQMCKYAYDLSSSYILGVDFDASAIRKANQLLSTEERSRIRYLVDDIDNHFFYTNLPFFDTIMLLSVIETLELENRYGILAKLSAKCNVMYLEGHINSQYTTLIDMLLKYTFFTSIEFKGLQYDNDSFEKQKQHRHVFRCSHQKYSRSDACNRIGQLLMADRPHIIAIIGNGGVGKTTFKHTLIEYLNENTQFVFDSTDMEYCQINNVVKSKNNFIIDKSQQLCIVDDLKISCEKLTIFKFIIYVDFRALEYIKNVNTIFYLNYDIDCRYHNREEKYKYDRSPSIHSYECIENIYNIDKY